MALTTLTSRVEEQDKAAFDDFCSSVGLTASAAINMYVKVVVRDRKIPFEIKSKEVTAPFTEGLEAFYALRSEAQNNGLQDLSLDEINEEIKSSRNKKSAF